MENIIIRDTKIELIGEVIQLVEKHKVAGTIVIGIGAIVHVLDKNLKELFQGLNNTIAENGCVI